MDLHAAVRRAARRISKPVLFVRVDCPLEELERREQQRGDRRPGQAREQIEKLHGPGVYDLTVDTYAQTLETGADQIIAALSHPECWSAFRILYRRDIQHSV